MCCFTADNDVWGDKKMLNCYALIMSDAKVLPKFAD